MSKLPDSVIEKAREDIVAVVESYGVELEKAGSEYRALCPFHSEKSPSFTVTPDKGRYWCFGCGSGGTSIDFVMQYEQVDFREAVQKITGAAEANPAPRERRVIEREEPVDEWTPLAIVPDGAPSPMNIINRKIAGRWTKLEAHACWVYRNAGGGIIGYIYRFNLPGGGKDVIPQTWCVNALTGELSWRWLSFSKPRPIYGLELLAANPSAQVLVVEGEKTCDAARALFDAAGVPRSKLVVISWPGGGKAVKHVDWTPLYRRKVGLWPDADQKPYVEIHQQAGELMPFLEQPGTIAMRDIHDAIQDQCEGIKLFMPPLGVPDGWDLGDDLPPEFELLSYMRTGSELAADVFAPEPDDIEPPIPDDIPWNEMAAEPDADESAPAPPRTRAAPAPERPASRAEQHDKLEDPGLGKNGYFRVLGYDHSYYYILAYEKCQILVYTKSDFSEPGLIELAPMQWWEDHFPMNSKSGGIDKKSAMNWLVRKANSRGVYSMNRLRGRGAWTDRGRLVFHHGDYLTVDGVRTEINDMESHFVYEMAEALPEIGDEELTDAEGAELLKLAAMFRWAKPASSALLAGWCALAPIGGAIQWRPHIWITGGAGSGKTHIQTRYANQLMNGMALYAQGNSTEAGIRQELKGDGRPVLFDESESQTEKEALRIQTVLAMVRQASSESPAKTYKGTAGGAAMAFHIRSMFCLASIQVGIKYQADIERMTVLSLRPKHDDTDAANSWKPIDNALHVMQRDETLPARLIRRSMNLLPTTLQNIAIFSEAGAIRFGSQRDGDQYGTLLAGAWSLISREVATLDAALEMIDMYDWSEHRENNETDEAERALATLMGAHIRVAGSASVTVNELLRSAKGYPADGVTVAGINAEAMLQRYGMRIEGFRLVLSNTSAELKRLMEGTPFESDLRNVLLRLRGSDRCGNRLFKFSGVPSKAISIPIDDLLEDDYMPAPAPTDQVSF